MLPQEAGGGKAQIQISYLSKILKNPSQLLSWLQRSNVY